MSDEVSAAELFDRLGARYEDAFADLPGQHAALDWLTARLPAGARVLDVGSGTGRPVAARLAAAGCAVTGIDVSPTMVDLARERVPGADFELADVRTYTPPDGGFDAVCAFFPLLVMSRPEVEESLRRIARWIVPGGYFVMATVPGDIEDVEIEWMGHRVRVSSLSAEDYVRRLDELGLEVLHTERSTYQPASETAGPEDHLFCYARRR
ncbi:class I SAM-dependent methyltransferase [Streptomyces antimicrobicus]|uniref:Class I SAM-dependent methyltransferase n=1 Tax=Streptomyces antimicrobicus TaxID=2883108 RepID=A0ABS8BDX7_9ACTN|nr:class I SAM-dependent methyltransferase [Streptomyces antimicrobicus]MCB5182815.1 class I SAM-dependent methyltransferase [Streptomyces antimicrobicus]